MVYARFWPKPYLPIFTTKKRDVKSFIANLASRFDIFFLLFGAYSDRAIIEDNPRSSLLSSGEGVQRPCRIRCAQRKDMGNSPPARCF